MKQKFILVVYKIWWTVFDKKSVKVILTFSFKFITIYILKLIYAFNYLPFPF